MNHQPNAYFFKIEKISEDSLIFEQLKKEELFFSYFQVDQNSYLFFYGETTIDIDLIDPHIHILEELDRKQRKIRSLRGFFLYAQEIIGSKEDSQILKTNLKPFFWRKLKNILRQNKKAVLQEFLFGNHQGSNGSKLNLTGSNPDLEVLIQNLQNQVNSLQDRIVELENQSLERERNLNILSEAPRRSKIGSSTLEQGNYTLKENQGSYLPQNDSQANFEVQDIPTMESKSVSEASKIDFTPLSKSEGYNISSNPTTAQNEEGFNLTSEQSEQPNFITLCNLPEEEKIEIIKLGFQLNQQEKISLKKYYESTDPYSLFQSKGYSIKYESIRRTKLYKKLKE